MTSALAALVAAALAARTEPHVAAVGIAARVAGDLEAPEFARDVAPVIAACCLSCHHGDGPGAYRLRTPADAKRVARTLLASIESGAMPPWLPVEGVVRVPRRPSAAEIARIRAWVEAGAPIAESERDAPIAMPEADAIAVVARWRLAEGWVVGGEERRVMRSFAAIPAAGADALGEDRLPEGDVLIGGWRVRSDAPGLVSLGLVTSGDAGLARALDERDASVGFRFTGDLGARPAGALAGFGIDGRFTLPPGFAMSLARGDALTFEMHADGRGRAESGACTVEALEPMAAARDVRVVEPFVVGPAGALRAATEDARFACAMPPLERDLDLVALVVRPGPDAVRVALRARSPVAEGSRVERAGDARSGATPSGFEERALLRIERYDVHADRPYVVEPPVRLTRGTVLSLEVESANATLAVRSTPQAVLLVADAGAGEIAADARDARAESAPPAEAAAARRSAPADALVRAFVDAAAALGDGGSRLLATPLVDAALYRELLGVEPEPRTGPTDAAGCSFFEAIELANALSIRCGLPPAYRVEFAERDGARLLGGVIVRTEGGGWRLPEADEWEVTDAARPGISGALWNWTFDAEGRERVVRGGCWADRADARGPAARSVVAPSTRSELFGARFVRPLGP